MIQPIIVKGGKDMKRKITFVALFLLIVATVIFLQFGREATVNHAETHSNPQGYEAHITITANKIHIFNKNKLIQEITRKTIDNTFKNMMFSYDILGYPNEVRFTVYANSLSKHLQIPSFTATYTQEIPYQYNIKDNPEMFTLSFD